jgi:hypothetical protein
MLTLGLDCIAGLLYSPCNYNLELMPLSYLVVGVSERL